MVEKKQAKTKKTTVKKTAVKKPAKKSVAKKKTTKKPAAKLIVKPPKKVVKYYEAIGRRKTAKARVRLFTRGDKEFLVNDKPYNKYFPSLESQQKAIDSLEKMKCLDKFRVLAKVKGGGLNAQAEAVRHGTARALVLFNPDFKKRLRRAGFLTRDPRMRERKKFGLKRARRAPQWRKR
jgi:small subunit ribosomal protein S9